MAPALRPPETFTTARLTARPITVADAPAVFAAYANDPEVTRYLTWPVCTKAEELHPFLATQEKTWRGENAGRFAWLLSRRDDGAVLGSIGVDIDGWKICCGYVLGRAHWGRGYMTEALQWVVDWGLAQPAIHRVWAFCDLENPASGRVMVKAGMTHEGLLRRWHVAPNLGPAPRDCDVYAKVR